MSFLARLGGRPAAAPRDFFTLLHIGPALGALLCLAILVWVAGTLRLPAKPGPVFLVCLFPGMMLGPLLVVIAGALTRTLA